MPNGKSPNKYVFNTRICQITVKSILRKLGRIYFILSENGTIVILNTTLHFCYSNIGTGIHTAPDTETEYTARS